MMHSLVVVRFQDSKNAFDCSEIYTNFKSSWIKYIRKYFLKLLNILRKSLLSKWLLESPIFIKPPLASFEINDVIIYDVFALNIFIGTKLIVTKIINHLFSFTILWCMSLCKFGTHSCEILKTVTLNLMYVDVIK